MNVVEPGGFSTPKDKVPRHANSSDSTQIEHAVIVAPYDHTFTKVDADTTPKHAPLSSQYSLMTTRVFQTFEWSSGQKTVVVPQITHTCSMPVMGPQSHAEVSTIIPQGIFVSRETS